MIWLGEPEPHQLPLLKKTWCLLAGFGSQFLLQDSLEPCNQSARMPQLHWVLNVSNCVLEIQMLQTFLFILDALLDLSNAQFANFFSFHDSYVS